MNLEAFEQLYRVLERVANEGKPFDIHDWSVNKIRKVDRSFSWLRGKGIEVTAAFCSIGWCAQDPWFIERGLRLAPADGNGRANARSVCVVYNNFSCWGGVSELFGITVKDAESLFDYEFYPDNPTPFDVISRVQAFVKNRQVAEAKQDNNVNVR
jgi:hypothetical protein